MKKIFFLILFIITFFVQKAYAEFIPAYTNSINHYGIGVARVTNFIKIYKSPDLNSEIIEHIYWNNIGNFITSNKNETKKPSDIFIAYSPEDNQVFLSVEDENDEWIEVCYNQKNPVFGWIKKEDEKNGAKFYPYKDLFFEYGKKYGIYAFRNLPQEYKALYASPNKESNVVDRFNYTKIITPWLVQGNWMLVKVITMDNETKTGWLRWRSDDGKLFGFVNLR